MTTEKEGSFSFAVTTIHSTGFKRISIFKISCLSLHHILWWSQKLLQVGSKVQVFWSHALWTESEIHIIFDIYSCILSLWTNLDSNSTNIVTVGLSEWPKKQTGILYFNISYIQIIWEFKRYIFSKLLACLLRQEGAMSKIFMYSIQLFIQSNAIICLYKKKNCITFKLTFIHQI